MNPELAIEKHSLNQMGLGLPDFRSDIKLPSIVATGTSLAILAGGVAVAKEFASPESAYSAPEACTAPTSEIPQPQNLPKSSGVDLTVYKPAFRSELCAQFPNTATTYIENVGAKTAKGVQVSFTGISYIAKGLTAVRIDDKPVQILDFNQAPSNGEEFCTRVEFNKDWTGRDTTTLRCWGGLRQRDLTPGQKMKIEVDLTPQRASNPNEVGGLEVAFPKAPYVSFHTQDKATPQTLPEDTNWQNDTASELVYVRDSQGNSSQVVLPSCRTPKLALKTSPGIITSKKGSLTTVLTAKTRISGAGNGAHKNPKLRAKAARIMLTAGRNVRINPKMLPKNALKVGNKIFIDVPPSGIQANKNLTRKIPLSFIGNRLGFTAKFIGPSGTVANCNKAMTISSSSLR